MRLYGIVLGMLLLWSGWSQADELPPGALGTRGGTPLRTVAPSSGGYAWLQMTVALLLIAAGLRYGLPRLIGWASKAGIGSRLDGEIRLLESRAVPGGSLLMVKARDRLLLIGATPQGIQLLADLTEKNADESPHSHTLSPLSKGGEGRGEGGFTSPTTDVSSYPEREQTRISEFERVLSRTTPPTGSPRGRGGPQQEVALALQAQFEQARARLARVAQQEEL
jgi:flagellar biogenesis protein FliO